MELSRIAQCICPRSWTASVLEVLSVADHTGDNWVCVITAPHVSKYLFNIPRVFLNTKPTLECVTIFISSGVCPLPDKICPFSECLVDLLSIRLVLFIIRVPVKPLEFV